jgi:hypothetical protein
VGGIVGVLLFWVAVAIAAAVVLRPAMTRRLIDSSSAFLLVLVAWWVLCVCLLRRDAGDELQVPFTLGIAVIVIALLRRPPTLQVLSSFNYIRDVAAALMLLASFIDPSGSQLSCRSDKCGIFGSLFLGFFFSENSAAQFILLLVPAAITIRSRGRLWLSLVLAATFLLATGSRTSLYDFAIVVGYVLLYRRYVLRGIAHSVWWVWKVVPLGFFVASLVAFLTLSGSALTGRGAIYAGIRAQIKDSRILTGSGPTTMRNIFDDGYLGHFQAFGEHGQAPHLFVQSGIVGLALFGMFVLSFVFGCREWGPAKIAGFGMLLGASLQFITEPGWTLNARTLNLVTMLLALGLFISDRRESERFRLEVDGQAMLGDGRA